MVEDPLAGVVIPPHPCPPAKHTLSEWYEEAATLDHLHFSPPDETRAWATAEPEAKRETVLRLAREGATFPAIAERVGDDIEAVALAIAKSAKTAPQMLAVEQVSREHPDWSCRQMAMTAGTTPSYVQWLLRYLGRETDASRRLREGLGTVHPESTYEKIRELRAKGWSWPRIGKVYGLSAGSVYQMHKRRFGKVAL